MNRKQLADKNLILFGFSAAIILSVFAIYPQLVAQKQDALLTNQKQLINVSKTIISEVAKNGNNRTFQLKAFVTDINENMTLELLKNREYIQNITKALQKDIAMHEIDDQNHQAEDDRKFNDLSAKLNATINANVTINRQPLFNFNRNR